MSLTVLKPGLLTTVQDLGRFGLQRHGVIVSGAMDSFAFRTANWLVGNQDGEAALEMTLIGPAVRFEADTLIAVTGGNLNPRIDEYPIPLWRPIAVKSGSVLRFSAADSGCRTYLAVAGGISVPTVMGSKSTYLRAGIGGYQGRALQATDVLEIGTPSPRANKLMKNLTEPGSLPFAIVKWRVSHQLLSFYQKNSIIRVIRGGQFTHFERISREQFFQTEYRVTPQSDRMGYRLSGAKLALTEPIEMISEAVTAGTIQVPPDGNPIVLLADRQTTGGYPKIGHVITADLPILAQVKPGETIRFQEISLEEAQNLYRSRERDLQLLRQVLAVKGN